MIPKAGVKFYRQRHLGVICIPAPLPIAFPPQGRHMVPNGLVSSGWCPIANFGKRIARQNNLFGRTVQVNVRLHPKARIFYIARPFRESFQNYMLDVRIFQAISDFGISCLGPLESPLIVRNVLFDS